MIVGPPRSSSARFFFPSPTTDDSSSAGNDVVANVANMVANQGVVSYLTISTFYHPDHDEHPHHDQVKAVQHMLHHVMHDLMVTGTETAYR